MRIKNFSEFFWGEQAKFLTLFLAAIILLFGMLGTHEIWTQEHRWADIVTEMFYRHDFLHPYLENNPYYDKPLLSYWLIIAFTYLTGHFSVWALRLPSAFAGLLAIWSIYRLGTRLRNKKIGMLAGWMLLTTFYFVFWARTSSADMLNMAGTLFAVSWYFDKKDNPTIFNYMIFFIILSLTALCKGLIGPVVTAIAIFPDLCMQQEWKKHLNWRVFISLTPGLLLYVFPFWLSAYFNQNPYTQNGLYLVYKENVLRYFQPFDHKGPIYTYFIFLPIYLLPWTLFFLPAIWNLKKNWSSFSNSSKWIVWSVLLLFVFFTLSGSRRNYYVLPMVPFAILLTADWIFLSYQQNKEKWLNRIIVFSFLTMALLLIVFQPLFYAQGGLVNFAKQVQQEAGALKPWSSWKFVMLDPQAKIRFYLNIDPSLQNNSLSIKKRKQNSITTLLSDWPILRQLRSDTIFISRKRYQASLQSYLKNYQLIETPLGFGQRYVEKEDLNSPIAFIPVTHEKM